MKYVSQAALSKTDPIFRWFHGNRNAEIAMKIKRMQGKINFTDEYIPRNIEPF